MKNLIFAILLGFVFCACSSNSTTATMDSTVDSVEVATDSMASDSLVVDSVVVDTVQ